MFLVRISATINACKTSLWNQIKSGDVLVDKRVTFKYSLVINLAVCSSRLLSIC
jgi:hypothetical protein